MNKVKLTLDDGTTYEVGEVVEINPSGLLWSKAIVGLTIDKGKVGIGYIASNPYAVRKLPPKHTVQMTYEDLRDLVAREKGGVEFERNDGIKVLFPVICNYLDGQLTICSDSIESFRCYRLYSENWTVEHPLTKDVEG